MSLFLSVHSYFSISLFGELLYPLVFHVLYNVRWATKSAGKQCERNEESLGHEQNTVIVCCLMSWLPFLVSNLGWTLTFNVVSILNDSSNSCSHPSLPWLAHFPELARGMWWESLMFFDVLNCWSLEGFCSLIFNNYEVTNNKLSENRPWVCWILWSGVRLSLLNTWLN